MDKLQAICAMITSYFETNGWDYKFDEEENFFLTGLALEGSIETLRLALDVNEEGYTVTGLLPLDVPEERLDQTARLLNRINCELRFGDLEMDEETRSISYFYPVDCRDSIPSPMTVQQSVLTPALAVDHYSPAICGVVQEGQSAAEAMAKLRLAEASAE